MNSRRLLMSAALVGSLGIALTPALAEASTSSSHPAVTNSGAAAFVKSGNFHVGVPLGASARHGSAVAHSSGTTTSSTGPNPQLQVGWGYQNLTTYEMELALYTQGLNSGSTATITVNWGDGTTDTVSVTGPSTNGPLSNMPTHTYAALGNYPITVAIDDGQGDTFSDASTTLSTGTEYTPLSPVRIMDTRSNTGATGPIAAQGIAHLQVFGADNGAIPSTATAVALNVTVTQGTGNGYLTVYGNQDLDGNLLAAPTTSNLNFRGGQDVANMVIVPVGKDGVVNFFNGLPKGAGSVQVIADVAGYYTPSTANEFVSMAPTRVLDTRSSGGPIGSNKSITVPVAGQDGIPSGATAVAVNLTAVDQTRNGLITAYPAGQTMPVVSNVNYSANHTVANMAIVRVGANGDITFENNSAGSSDLLADVAGYYTTSSVTGASTYVSFQAPTRFVDTRDIADATLYDFGALPALTATAFPVAQTNAPEPAAVFNATVVSPTASGYLSLDPFNPGQQVTTPSTSNINYTAGQTVPNLAFVTPGTVEDDNTQWEQIFGAPSYAAGMFIGGHGTAQVILDQFGYFVE